MLKSYFIKFRSFHYMAPLLTRLICKNEVFMCLDSLKGCVFLHMLLHFYTKVLYLRLDLLEVLYLKILLLLFSSVLEVMFGCYRYG